VWANCNSNELSLDGLNTGYTEVLITSLCFLHMYPC